MQNSKYSGGCATSGARPIHRSSTGTPSSPGGSAASAPAIFATVGSTSQNANGASDVTFGGTTPGQETEMAERMPPSYSERLNPRSTPVERGRGHRCDE